MELRVPSVQGVNIAAERSGPTGPGSPLARKGVSLMANPNAGILEEIHDQNLDAVAAGQGWGTVVSTLGCYGASYVLGNKGNFCTATSECQSNCK
ncbi:plantaricin C family lantibiotic [Streptomyces sp. NPDC058579]|uniref:plantaricin C family lantibiotic n=1 Tax=Streptomyces sp. NPDC058579 TaxID=3346548 RepID=UPI00364EE4C3